MMKKILLTCMLTILCIQFNFSQRLNYLTTNSYDLSTLTIHDEYLSIPSGTESTLKGFTFSEDGNKLFFVGFSNDRLYMYNLASPFSLVGASYSGQSLYVGGDKNGISFSNDGTKLFLVDGGDRHIYQYNLSTAYDLSSASFYFSYHTAQPLRDIILASGGTRLILLYHGAVQSIYLNNPFDLSDVAFFGGYSNISSEIDDASGFHFNIDGTKLFIADNKTNDIHAFNLTSPFNTTSLISNHSGVVFNRGVSILEGVFFNTNGSKFFLINDATNRIEEYIIDNSAFYLEALSNDGSIDNSNPLTIQLQGDTFQDVDDDNLLDLGTEITIQNTPLGLNPVITLSNSDTKATLTFTGNAINHENSEDISSLVFSFNDLAFTNLTASEIENSGSYIPLVSLMGIDFNDAVLHNPKFSIDMYTSIYPNPSKDYLIISIKNLPSIHINYTLFSATGAKLATGKINNDETTLSIKHLNDGVYFINLVNIDSQILKTFKIIKR